MTDDELMKALQEMKSLMVSASTGGPQIDSVNGQYKQLCVSVEDALRERNIENPNPFSDLWDWYGRWSSGDLPSYRSRRQFISEMFAPTLTQMKNRAAGVSPVSVEPTGWARVDRTIDEIRKRLAQASNEEQFQAVGLLCREALISLAQSVYDSAKHPTLDGVVPSSTDAKRMLEAYVAVELTGASNQVLRKHARASFDLALELQHRRTANFRQAALCAEATSAVANLIAIVSGRRDP
jgi:hypothetical protein